MPFSDRGNRLVALTKSSSLGWHLQRSVIGTMTSHQSAKLIDPNGHEARRRPQQWEDALAPFRVRCKTHTVHDNDDPGFDRYTRALRRQWWVLGLSALVGAALAISAAGSRYEAAAHVLVVNNGGIIDTSDMLAGGLLAAVPVSSDIAAGKALAINDLVTKIVGTDSKITLVLTDSGSFTINAEAARSATVDSALTAAFDQMQQVHVSLIEQATAPVLESLTAQEASTEKRISDVDRDLAALPSDQGPLEAAYSLERLRLTTILSDVDRRTDAVTSYRTAAKSAFRLDGIDTPTQPSLILNGLVGVFGGAIVAALALIALTIFDRRVRCWSDVSAVTTTQPIGVIGRVNDAVGVAVVSAALTSVKPGSDQTLHIVPVGTSSLGVSLVGELTQAMRARGAATGASIAQPFHTDPNSAIGSATGDVVLFIRWAKARDTDIVEAVNGLQGSHRTVSGLVLYDVPNRARRSALR